MGKCIRTQELEHQIEATKVAQMPSGVSWRVIAEADKGQVSVGLGGRADHMGGLVCEL